MSNWYKKAGGKSGIPRMFQTPEERETTELTRPELWFGTNERSTSDGKGYPKGISQHEDRNDDKGGVQGIIDEIPAGRTILDDDIPIGEGANDDRFVDPEDRPPKKRHPDPVGPHNMQDNVFRNVSNRTRLRTLNRV